jgi:hypothetical protein
VSFFKKPYFWQTGLDIKLLVEVAESGDNRYLLFMVSGKPLSKSLLKEERL